MRQSKHALFSMAKKLFLLHLVFIIITVIMLNFGPLAIISSLIYILALFLAGLQGTRIHKTEALTTLAAGYLSQIIGILSSFFVLTKSLWNFSIEPFEFIAQIWQTPPYPLYPLLPPTSYFDMPLYFFITITASFVLPLIPALGAGLSRLFTSIWDQWNTA
jgi:hypothetical protein